MGKITELRTWWKDLVKFGPKFGYFPNASKSWLVTKESTHNLGKELFGDEGIQVTDEGRPYLGAAIGTVSYTNDYVRAKVTQWSSQLTTLARIASTQPHAVYSALIHGFTSKWTYLCRTIPDISELMRPLDNILRSSIIPALTGRPPPNDLEATLFSMPVRKGGLGIRLPSNVADSEFRSSTQITSPICAHIASQHLSNGPNIAEAQVRARAETRKINRAKIDHKTLELLDTLPEGLRTSIKLAQEKGSSTWLTSLPLAEHGFSLHRSAFHDAMALRYGWTPKNLPAKCHCGARFSVEHALSCPKGGFPTIRHNEIRDLTASLLSEVCKDVCTEPTLQPIPESSLNGACANHQPGARLDVAANGVWGGQHERTFFDVKVFNPHAPSNKTPDPQTAYRKHEKIKKRDYEERILNFEQATFTPIIMSTTGGMGKEATALYKRLATMLAAKWGDPYSRVLCWLRCRLGFSLLRSSIQAIRGARSSNGHPVICGLPLPLDLIQSEAAFN